MKIFTALVYCLLTPSLYMSPSSLTNPPPARSNVYLITIDTLRSDHVGCYGYERIQTPAMDQLARDGIRFEQAFTPSPLTNVSHTTILTGLLPSSHGVRDFGTPLMPAYPTLGEMLRKNGYRTAAFIGAVILDSKTLAPGLDRGFDFYDDFPQQPATKSRWGRLERRGMHVVQRAEDWLNKSAADAHQFVWIHLYDPHDPYEPPAPFYEEYKSRLYDGEIAYADSALAHFLAYLKRNNWYEDALIILVGDHGEGLGEHGEDTHGIFLYDSTAHVPLIVKLPGQQEAGKVVHGQARTTDIAPTVLDLLSFPVPSLDGVSLSGAMFKNENPQTVFGETDYPVRFGWAPLRSVRKDGFKLVESPRPEVYDLQADPGETRNRYVPWDATTQKLRKALADLRAKSPRTESNSRAAVTAATVSELRALGYLDASDARSTTSVPEPSLLPDPKDKIEQHNLLHHAVMAAEDGRIEDARAALQRLMRLQPDYPIALRQLGQLEMSSGNPAKAVQYFKRLCEVLPTDSTAAFEYGRSLSLSAQLPAARVVLLKSLKLNPNQIEARVLLGQMDLKSSNYKSAESEFESALQTNPASTEAQIGLARALLGQRKFADAAEMLEVIASTGSESAELFDLLAVAYRAQGKIRQAKQAEERARNLKTTSRR